MHAAPAFCAPWAPRIQQQPNEEIGHHNDEWYGKYTKTYSWPCCWHETDELIEDDYGTPAEPGGCCHYEEGFHQATLDLEVKTWAGDTYCVKGCINPEDGYSGNVAMIIVEQYPELAPADRFELWLLEEKLDLKGERPAALWPWDRWHCQGVQWASQHGGRL